MTKDKMHRPADKGRKPLSRPLHSLRSCTGRDFRAASFRCGGLYARRLVQLCKRCIRTRITGCRLPEWKAGIIAIIQPVHTIIKLTVSL